MNDEILESLKEYGIELPSVPNSIYGNNIGPNGVNQINQSENNLMNTIKAMYEEVNVKAQKEEIKSDSTLDSINEMLK